MNYGPDLTTATIKMVLSLGVVLLMVWGLYRLAKSKLALNTVSGNTKLMRLMESQYVGVKKSIAMVEIPGSILVLGIGSDNVNLLTQISDPEVIEGIKSVPNNRKFTGFKEQLNRLTHGRNISDHNVSNDRVAK